MGKVLAFLDFFANSKIRDAFVHSKAAFVIDKNSRQLLWINAKAANFFGFADCLGVSNQQEILGLDFCQNIANAWQVHLAHQNSSNERKRHPSQKINKIKNTDEIKNIDKIALQGKNGRKYFSLQKLDSLNHSDCLILATAVQKPKLINKKALLDGLQSDISAAAILDNAGKVLYASKNFQPFDTIEKVMALADDAMPQVAMVHQNGKDYNAHIIKIAELDCYLLHMLALQDLDNEDSSDLLANLLEKQQSLPIKDKNGLSDIERSAFREIADRLRVDIESDDKNKDKNENFADIISLLSSPLPDNQMNIENMAAKEPMAKNRPEQVFQPKPASIYNLLDTVTDGVVWLDHLFRIRYFSYAATALTYYESNMLEGAVFSSVFTKASQTKINKYLQGFSKSGTNLIFSSGESGNFIAGNGALIPLFVTVVPLAKGEGYAALLKDMTNRVHKKSDILDNLTLTSDKTLAETMHEIRTPLNAMLGFAEIMQQEHFGAVDNPRYQRYLHDIVQSAKHILALVNRHLEQAKLQHNGEDIQENSAIIPFNVVTILRESVSLLEKQMQDNGITIRIILPETLPDIMIEEQEFRQIIWNILANSIRFTKKNGKIVVYAALIAKEYVQISVSDNGIGMSEEEMSKAILPFGQIARKDGRVGDETFVGTGLGLPTTKKLVEKNGGQFILLSIPNHGTTVEMSFPLYKTANI